MAGRKRWKKRKESVWVGCAGKGLFASQTLREEKNDSKLTDERFHFQLALKNMNGGVRKHVRVEAVARRGILFRSGRLKFPGRSAGCGTAGQLLRAHVARSLFRRTGPNEEQGKSALQNGSPRLYRERGNASVNKNLFVIIGAGLETAH